MAIQIGLIGDYSPEVVAHVAIPQALELAANNLGVEVKPTWLPTDKIVCSDEEQFAAFDGLWCVPASPYASTEGALRAIQFARESQRPFLGTCGGFQHAVLEYARNVLGYEEAGHAESDPTTAMPLLAPLACALRGTDGAIKLKAGSQIHRIYGRDEIIEQYNCGYGVNAHYEHLLESGAMKITGVDTENEARVVEISENPFFIATLFQPERSAKTGIAHPLIQAYVQAAGSVSSAAHGVGQCSKIK